MPAGIDRFARDLVAQHFGGDNACPGVPVDRILALGAEDYDGGDPSVFNMAVMGLRLAQRANGVSELHGARQPATCSPGCGRASTSPRCRSARHQRRARADLGRAARSSSWPAREIGRRARPSRRAAGRTSQRGPRRRHLGAAPACCGSGSSTTSAGGCARPGVQRGASDAELGWIDEVLDPDVLTIGFARRVPSYKRLTLMLRDPERLTRAAARTPSGRSRS